MGIGSSSFLGASGSSRRHLMYVHLFHSNGNDEYPLLPNSMFMIPINSKLKKIEQIYHRNRLLETLHPTPSHCHNSLTALFYRRIVVYEMSKLERRRSVKRKAAVALAERMVSAEAMVPDGWAAGGTGNLEEWEIWP